MSTGAQIHKQMCSTCVRIHSHKLLEPYHEAAGWLPFLASPWTCPAMGRTGGGVLLEEAKDAAWNVSMAPEHSCPAFCCNYNSPSRYAESLDPSPGGPRLVVGGHDPWLRAWEVETGCFAPGQEPPHHYLTIESWSLNRLR